MSTTVAVYDTKPYDRGSLARAQGAETMEWRVLDFRLEPGTVHAASGAQAVCVFVNDDASRTVLERLAGLGVRLLALRCAGSNKVDLAAAKELGLPVTRVPNYSPYSVAEHTVALILALNRKLHRAFNRVRELNFSLTGLEGVDLHGKTAGIFGTGRIGRIVAEILKGFGMRVLAFDPYPSQEWAAQHGVVYTDQQTLAREGGSDRNRQHREHHGKRHAKGQVRRPGQHTLDNGRHQHSFDHRTNRLIQSNDNLLFVRLIHRDQFIAGCKPFLPVLEEKKQHEQHDKEIRYQNDGIL